MENANGSTKEDFWDSKLGDATSRFAWTLLFASIVGVPICLVRGGDFFKLLCVSLALATLVSLHPFLDAVWTDHPLGMMEIGLVAGALVWLVFSTGFFTVIAVFLALGLLFSLLTGEERREELRQFKEQWRKEEREARARKKQKRQEVDRKVEAEDDRLGQEKRDYSTSRQEYSEPAASPRPHELRALPYKEYLQTPHWKRKREAKLRAVGRRCQVCGRSSGTLDVHHSTYDRLGEELEGDLTVLCRGCHGLFHEHRRLGPPGHLTLEWVSERLPQVRAWGDH